jgi:hypothetical protein
MTVKTNGFVSLKALEYEKASLLDCYRLSFQAQVATNELGKVTGSCFGRLRGEARTMYGEMLEKVGGDRGKMDFELLRELFNMRLSEQAEAQYDGTDEAKAFGLDSPPAVWTQSKSQVGKALERGFDFVADPEVSQNNLRKWVSNFDKAIKDRDMQERIRKAKEAGLLKDMTKPKDAGAPSPESGKVEDPQPGGDAGDLPAGVEGDKPAANEPPSLKPAASLKAGACSLSDEQLALIQETIDSLNEIAAVRGNGSVKGILNSFANNVKQAHAKLDKAISNLANVG